MKDSPHEFAPEIYSKTISRNIISIEPTNVLFIGYICNFLYSVKYFNAALLRASKKMKNKRLYFNTIMRIKKCFYFKSKTGVSYFAIVHFDTVQDAISVKDLLKGKLLKDYLKGLLLLISDILKNMIIDVEKNYFFLHLFFHE